MKAEELSDLDPFDLFDTEAERLDAYFSSLRGEEWLRPSRCAGWTIRDVLGHLAGEELYNHACLDGDIAGFYQMLRREGVAGGYRGFNEWCVARRRDLPVEQVLEEWRTANRDTRTRMRALGRDAMIDTSVGKYPNGLQAFHYASEYATHADDVDAPVTPEEQEARTAWRARVGRFVLTERHSPVVVEPINGRYRVSVGQVSDELSASELVAATVDRLPADHRLDPTLRESLVVLA